MLYLRTIPYLDQWKGQTASEKQAVLSTFLKECGELASWKEWLDFLNSQDWKADLFSGITARKRKNGQGGVFQTPKFQLFV